MKGTSSPGRAATSLRSIVPTCHQGTLADRREIADDAGLLLRSRGCIPRELNT